MPNRDWFRNKDWNTSIEAQFQGKLRRARDKRQYLRIQASYLAQQHPEAALKLLQQYFALGEHFDLAQAYLSEAEAYVSLGDYPRAIDAFRRALQREREYPNLQTVTWRTYAAFVTSGKQTNLYAEILDILLQYKPASLTFVTDQFAWFATHAQISAQFGRRDDARESANKALALIEVKHSGFRYHPDVGLVSDEQRALVKELTQLASTE